MAAVFTAAWIVFGAALGIHPLKDNSFFWHLRTGHWIIDHGFPRGDIYSYTVPGRPWVVQSWLAEVLYGGLDDLFGPIGVRVFGAVLSAAIAGLAFRLAMRLARDHVTAVFLGIPAILGSAMLWSERPLAIGVLTLLLLVSLVELPESRLGRRPLVAIPVLLYVWANVHGTWAIGFGYLGLHLAGRWLDGHSFWRGRERRIAQGAGIAFAACFATPYGVANVLFPFRLLGLSDVLSGVGEWMSPSVRSPQGLLFAVWIVVLIGVLARTRPSRRDVAVTVPFVLLGLWAQRNIAVAPIATLPIAARLAARPVPRPDLGRAFNLLLVAGVVAAGALWTGVVAARPDFDVREYPVAALRALDERGQLGQRLFTTDVWAGYTMLTYGPDRQKVFADDRYDMYPRRLSQRYADVAAVAPRWAEILDAYRVTVVVWPRDAPLTQALVRDAHWRRTYLDGTAAVFVRAG